MTKQQDSCIKACNRKSPVMINREQTLSILKRQCWGLANRIRQFHSDGPTSAKCTLSKFIKSSCDIKDLIWTGVMIKMRQLRKHEIEINLWDPVHKKADLQVYMELYGKPM